MIIIGFTGPAGCGKDTAAMALVRQLGFTRMSFAAPIKEALDTIFGWDPGMWLDRAWKEDELNRFGASPRRMAQTLGTDWAREMIHPDFWVRVLEHRMHNGEATKIVISDVRFDNEATWILDHGGFVIDVTRELSDRVEAHSSEDGVNWKYIQYKLANQGGVKELEEEAVHLVRELL